MDWQQRIDRLNRQALVCLIRTVGQGWAEDDEFLEDYIVDQVNLWSTTPERLQQAIVCFEQLKEQVCGKGISVVTAR
jgi:hypothetical protein